MTEIVYLGPGPQDEDLAREGRPDYEGRAMREARHYIAAIRIVLGEEPEGAPRLRVTREESKRGSYIEVACEYDAGDAAAAAYAQRCLNDAPTEWAQAGLRAPGRGRER